MSSPSRPASQALMMVSTSLRLMSFFTPLYLDSVLSIGFSLNVEGMIGRFASLQKASRLS